MRYVVTPCTFTHFYLTPSFNLYIFVHTPAQTIAGGSGAGPGWHGTSGVHTHITNTRIGDIEILERRYPVLLHRFGLRNDSAGAGRWAGGEGVVRELEFTEPLQVSILSEVRSADPVFVHGHMCTHLCCLE